MDKVLNRISKFQKSMKNIFDPFEGKRPRVLLLGLDGAGKTALLYKSKLDDTIYANVPPRGINIEHMTPRRGASMQVYDMTGNKVSRLMWQQWFRGAEALVYVVDSADRVRVDEAKFELHELLKSRDVRRVPVIIVANKQDEEDALAVHEVRRELNLEAITDRDWAIFGTSAKKGTGISAVFKDAVDKIIAFRHYKNGLKTNTNSARRTPSKKSVKSEKSDETRSVSNCSSIEEPAKVKSLFDSIHESNSSQQDDGEQVNGVNGDDVSEENNSDASAKYDAIAMSNDDTEAATDRVNVKEVDDDDDSNDSDGAYEDVAGDKRAESADKDNYETIASSGATGGHGGQREDEDVSEAYGNKTYDFAAAATGGAPGTENADFDEALV